MEDRELTKLIGNIADTNWMGNCQHPNADMNLQTDAYREPWLKPQPFFLISLYYIIYNSTHSNLQFWIKAQFM